METAITNMCTFSACYSKNSIYIDQKLNMKKTVKEKTYTSIRNANSQTA